MDYLQLSRIQRELADSFDSILNYINEVEEIAKSYPKRNSFVLRDEKITLKLYNYLMNGFSYFEAKQMVCEELQIPKHMIEGKIDAQYSIWLKRIRPHKVYAAQKMSACGIPIKKIAEILEVTPATIRTYLTIKNVNISN